MHRRTVRLVAALLAGSILLAACGSDDDDTTAGGPVASGDACVEGRPGDADEVEAILSAAQEVMDTEDLNAVTLSVTRDGEEVVTAALGETMTGVPATPGMHVRNGAIAIAYLGTALLTLVDDGTVSLDDTIDAWLPDVPESDQVTLRDLIASTSGYQDYVGNPAFDEVNDSQPFKAWTEQELLDIVFAEPLWYEPGTNASYSHGNFVLLGQALSEITGQPLEEVLAERVLDPMGLDSTFAFVTAEIPEPVLHAFTAERGTYEESTFWNPSWTLAHGAIQVTTVCDVATSARSIGTGALISDESFAEMMALQVEGADGPDDDCPACIPQTETAHFGLGVVVLNGWIYQNPLFAGFGSAMGYLPDEGLAIATTATAGPTSKPDVNYGDRVFQAIAAELAPDQLPQP